MKLYNIDVVQYEDVFAAYHLGKKVEEAREKHGGLGELLLNLCTKNVVKVASFKYYNKLDKEHENRSDWFPEKLSDLIEANK